MNHSQRYLTLPGELFLFSGSCLEFSNPSLHLFQPGTGTGQYLLLNLKFLAGHQLQPIKGAAQCRVQVSTHLLCESLWQQGGDDSSHKFGAKQENQRSISVRFCCSQGPEPS